MVSDEAGRGEPAASVRAGVRPDPDLVSSVAELGYQLRLLRISVGAPSLRRLADIATANGDVLPRSTISNALSGRHLPALDVVLGFVRACERAPAEVSRWRAAWQRAYASRHAATPPSHEVAP